MPQRPKNTPKPEKQPTRAVVTWKSPEPTKDSPTAEPTQAKQVVIPAQKPNASKATIAKKAAANSEVKSSGKKSAKTIAVAPAPTESAVTPAPTEVAAKKTMPIADPKSAQESKSVVTTAKKEVKSGFGFISLNTIPAAEVYLNRRRMGTTVDAMSSSGWLKVKSGEVLVELRRKGYKTYSKVIELKPNERLQLHGINLESDTSNNREMAAKTIHAINFNVNPLPAEVNIEDSSTGSSQKISLSDNPQSVQLLPGRYKITVLYKEQTRVREVVLPGPYGDLTFSVEFKED
jgi:hypothetical protein